MQQISNLTNWGLQASGLRLTIEPYNAAFVP